MSAIYTQAEETKIPQRFVDLAHRRVAPLMHYYGKHIGSFDLTELLASCYVQGIEDASVAFDAPDRPISQPSKWTNIQ